ncbi:MAG: prolipoprotein diacylglyceryl transferase [Planctomycetia bacterium]|nr:prolipoprotein diacylglyceryl transferase [Planctomycetia bacterium]
MLQTLYYIPLEIAGVPVFGVGWLLAVWTVVSVVLLATIGVKHGVGAELASYVPLVGLVAVAIVWLLPAVCEPEGLPIRGYGSMLLVAVVSGTGLLVWRGRRVGLEADLMVSLVFWMFVPGILGARLFYIIEYWHDYQKATFGQTLAAAVNITKGGLVVYGSLIGGLVGYALFVRKHRLPLLAIGDLLAPCLLLGLALGRMGCLLNGCCFGGACELPWAVTFPLGSPVYDQEVMHRERPSLGQLLGMTLGVDGAAEPVLEAVEPDGPLGKSGLRRGDRLTRIAGHAPRDAAEADLLLQHALVHQEPFSIETADGRTFEVTDLPVPPRSLPVHPTQPYSAINALLICLFLLAYEPFRRRDGELFALMLTIYPVTRFLLEIIRTDESAIFGTGLSISQNVSLLVMLGVAALWFHILRRPRGITLPAAVES